MKNENSDGNFNWASQTTIEKIAHDACIEFQNQTDVSLMVGFLADKKAQKMATNEGVTLLHYAAQENKSSLVYALCQLDMVQSTKSCDTPSPIHIAAANGSIESIRVLLDAGMNVDALDLLKKTPLMYAVKFRPSVVVNNIPFILTNKLAQQEIVKLLISEGSNVNAVDLNNRTAIFSIVDCASRNAWSSEFSVNMLDLLIISGANVEHLDKNGESALKCSAGMPDEYNELFIHLLKLSPSLIDQADKHGATPLHNAVGRNRNLCALIDAGASVNVFDENMLTPLHLSAIHDDPSSALELMKAGADHSFKDIEGYTPRQIAVLRGKDQWVNVFDAYQASIKANEAIDEMLLMEKDMHKIL